MLTFQNTVGYCCASKVIWQAFLALVSSSDAEKLKFNFLPSSGGGPGGEEKENFDEGSSTAGAEKAR
jgi:hypothetical protein